MAAQLEEYIFSVRVGQTISSQQSLLTGRLAIHTDPQVSRREIQHAIDPVVEKQVWLSGPT
jgi:hypothetical protein